MAAPLESAPARSSSPNPLSIAANSGWPRAAAAERVGLALAMPTSATGSYASASCQAARSAACDLAPGTLGLRQRRAAQRIGLRQRSHVGGRLAGRGLQRHRHRRRGPGHRLRRRKPPLGCAICRWRSARSRPSAFCTSGCNAVRSISRAEVTVPQFGHFRRFDPPTRGLSISCGGRGGRRRLAQLPRPDGFPSSTRCLSLERFQAALGLLELCCRGAAAAWASENDWLAAPFQLARRSSQ